MKKILSILIIVLALSYQLNASTIFHGNVYDAQKQALKEAKIIVFIIASSSCQFCHKFLNDISLRFSSFNNNMLSLIGLINKLNIFNTDFGGMAI